MFEQETLGKDWSYLLIGVTPPKHAVAKDYKIGCFNYKTSKYEHEVAVLHYHDLTRNLALLTEAEDTDKRILVTKTKGTIQFWSLASNFKAKSVQQIDKIDPQDNGVLLVVGADDAQQLLYVCTGYMETKSFKKLTTIFTVIDNEGNVQDMFHSRHICDFPSTYPRRATITVLPLMDMVAFVKENDIVFKDLNIYEKNFEIVKTRAHEGRKITAACYIQKIGFLLSGDQTGNVRCWNIKTLKIVCNLRFPGEIKEITELKERPEIIFCVVCEQKHLVGYFMNMKRKIIWGGILLGDAQSIFCTKARDQRIAIAVFDKQIIKVIEIGPVSLQNHNTYNHKA